MSCGKWAPLKLIAIVSPPWQHELEGRPYHKSPQTKTCDRTRKPLPTTEHARWEPMELLAGSEPQVGPARCERLQHEASLQAGELGAVAEVYPSAKAHMGTPHSSCLSDSAS